MGQPLIKDNILVIASRDGNTYGIDLKTKKKIWDFNYGNTWAMSTNISDNTVFVGWSTNDKFCALDLTSGKKIWDYKTKGHNFPKALISKTSVYTTSSDGNLYRLNKQTGEKIWYYSTGKEIYSSPIYDTKTIFFGSDDGYLYAINNGQTPYKIVYQPIDDKGNYKNPKVSNQIVPFLVEKGFKHISDENDLQEFINNRLHDKTPSVIVFPYLIISKNIIGTDPKKGLMRQYLDTGGKVIWPGDVPNYYERDETGKQIRSEDMASKLLAVTFNNPKEFGIYFSKTTQEGRNWGASSRIKNFKCRCNNEL